VTEQPDYRCSFCGTPRAKVKYLVVEDVRRAYICDVCVISAVSVLLEAGVTDVPSLEKLGSSEVQQKKAQTLEERVTELEEQMRDVQRRLD
jgi:hypothetical protein